MIARGGEGEEGEKVNFVLFLFKKGNFIQGWTLFKGGNYLRKYSILCSSIFSIISPETERPLAIGH